jgi:hypothetical protein
MLQNDNDNDIKPELWPTILILEICLKNNILNKAN